MKKCPQCGTILEDSKKKCYMCGTEFQKRLFEDFGDTFDEQIGATVTNGQDNVFNSFENVINISLYFSKIIINEMCRLK